MTDPVTLAALQLGTDPAGTAATLDRIMSFESAIIGSDAAVVVMPEALLGGYPKGEGFGTRLGYRLPEGRAAFAAYHAQAIDLDGPEVAALASLSARTSASIVIGVIERQGATLYCTALFFDPEAGLVAKHRKLMPTAAERLIWGLGDGSTLPVVDSRAGRLGAAICWETTCRCCARQCMPRALRSGVRPPSMIATSGAARCATSRTKAAAS